MAQVLEGLCLISSAAHFPLPIYIRDWSLERRAIFRVMLKAQIINHDVYWLYEIGKPVIVLGSCREIFNTGPTRDGVAKLGRRALTINCEQWVFAY